MARTLKKTPTFNDMHCGKTRRPITKHMGVDLKVKCKVNRFISEQYHERRIQSMCLLPDTWNCALPMRRECRERFPRPTRVSDPDMHHARVSIVISICPINILCTDMCQYGLYYITWNCICYVCSSYFISCHSMGWRWTEAGRQQP